MPIRLIFWGGSRERNSDGTVRNRAINDNSAFYHAAINLTKNYKDWANTGRIIKIDCADSIVRTINSQSDNSIKSLDIVSHGTPISLNFSVIEDKNCGLYTSGFSRTLVWLYAPFDSEVNSPDNRSRKISEIDFAKFTEDARAEFHGCNAASWNPALNSLVEEFSKNLFSSGKTRAVSIGHTEKANPKIYGDKTTIP